jgi:hypothetical protein
MLQAWSSFPRLLAQYTTFDRAMDFSRCQSWAGDAHDSNGLATTFMLEIKTRSVQYYLLLKDRACLRL